MDIGIIGGGINGLCCAWRLAEQGHQVRLYERNKIMNATSRASSKLLHGGLRYLENGEFRLVREALRERDAWIERAPELAKPLRLIMPHYRSARRPSWMVAVGLFLYDHLAGNSRLPKAQWLSKAELLERDPDLNPAGLHGGHAFSDGHMDDHALGLWVAEQARGQGAVIAEQTAVEWLDINGHLQTANGQRHRHDHVINIAGPWASWLLAQSGIDAPYQLDLIRGSHLVLDISCQQAYLLEVPDERRILFVLPWQGHTLLGTTEVRQALSEPIVCSGAERDYLLGVYRHYFPRIQPKVIESFAGLRPLIQSAKDPNKASREYAIYRTGQCTTVFGGKWTTAMALADKVAHALS